MANIIDVQPKCGKFTNAFSAILRTVHWIALGWGLLMLLAISPIFRSIILYATPFILLYLLYTFPILLTTVGMALGWTLIYFMFDPIIGEATPHIAAGEWGYALFYLIPYGILSILVIIGTIYVLPFNLVWFFTKKPENTKGWYEEWEARIEQFGQNIEQRVAKQEEDARQSSAKWEARFESASHYIEGKINSAHDGIQSYTRRLDDCSKKRHEKAKSLAHRINTFDLPVPGIIKRVINGIKMTVYIATACILITFVTYCFFS